MKIQEQVNLLAQSLRNYLESVYDEKSNSLKLDIKERNTIERLDVVVFYLSKSNYKSNKKIDNYYNETVRLLEEKTHSPVLLIMNYIQLTVRELKINIIISDFAKEIIWN